MENKGIERIWELMSRKLSAEISVAELEELEVLLKQQAQQAYSLEIMEDIWKSKAAQNSQYAEYKYKELFHRMQKEGLIIENLEEESAHLIGSDETNHQGFFGRNVRKIFIGSSALVLSAFAIFFIFFNADTVQRSSAPNKISEVTTKNGSKTNVVLPDGTKVWLNAGSKLSYENDKYGAELREVTLIGEAFFDVTKNAEKPFVIHTQRMDIKVLGTAFNVRCYPNDKKTETSLIRGKIEVTLKDRPKEKIYLSPNEKLTLLNGNIVTPELPSSKRAKHSVELIEPLVTIGHITRKLTDSATIIETSWIENKLEFRGETFEEVASKMERWYGVKINIEDYRLKQEHLTGSFETETVEQALAALQYTTKFNFSTNKNTITITK
jgi:ferric-dicitrate binding protein FerR (iron transport regulator)